MGPVCGWRHAQKRWTWEFEDFEKCQLGTRPLKDIDGFSTVHFYRSRPAEMNWDLKHHKMRRT